MASDELKRKMELLEAEMEVERELAIDKGDPEVDHMDSLVRQAESGAEMEHAHFEKALQRSRRRAAFARLRGQGKKLLRNLLFLGAGGAFLYFVLTKLHIVIFSSFSGILFFLAAGVAVIYLIVRALFAGDPDEKDG